MYPSRYMYFFTRCSLWGASFRFATAWYVFGCNAPFCIFLLLPMGLWLAFVVCRLVLTNLLLRTFQHTGLGFWFLGLKHLPPTSVGKGRCTPLPHWPSFLNPFTPKAHLGKCSHPLLLGGLPPRPGLAGPPRAAGCRASGMPALAAASTHTGQTSSEMPLPTGPRTFAQDGRSGLRPSTETLSSTVRGDSGYPRG